MMELLQTAQTCWHDICIEKANLVPEKVHDLSPVAPQPRQRDIYRKKNQNPSSWGTFGIIGGPHLDNMKRAAPGVV